MYIMDYYDWHTIHGYKWDIYDVSNTQSGGLSEKLEFSFPIISGSWAIPAKKFTSRRAIGRKNAFTSCRQLESTMAFHAPKHKRGVVPQNQETPQWFFMCFSV